MVLPSLRRILASDFDTNDQPLVNKLAFPINSAFDSINLALNNNLTFQDNMLCTTATFTVSVNASGSVVPKPIITLSTAQQGMTITGLLVLNATNVNNILPTGGIFINFSNASNSITINNIKGLPPNIPFTLKIAAFS